MRIQVGNVPEINNVKIQLDKLKEQKLIKEWEIPYERILTRLTAAIFFLTPEDDAKVDEIWNELSIFPRFKYVENTEKNLSEMNWKVEFNKDFEL